MLEETAKFFKEAQIKDLRKNLKDFCKALGQRVPREIDTQLKLAQQIAENGLAIEQETQDLSITELQELIHTVKRASQLRNKEKRLLKFRELIESSIGQAAEGALAMRGKDLLLHFSAELMLGDSFSPDILDSHCSAFVEDFLIDYVSYHNSWHAERRSVGKRYFDLRRRAKALFDLNTIPQLGEPLGEKIVEEVMNMPSNLPECGILEVSEIGYAPVCPRCGLPYRAALSWKRFFELEKAIAPELEMKVDALARTVADKIVKLNENDPLRAFIDAVGVSDLDKLCVILTDDVLSTIKKVLS